MQHFVQLFRSIDATTSSNAKIDALVEYFRAAAPADAAWAVYFLSGKRLKRFITSRDLQLWARQLTGLPEWLFAECYSSVGDTAETVALLVGNEQTGDSSLSLQQWLENRILPLRQLEKAQQAQAVKGWWQQLSITECFVLNKMLTGAFRVGVAKTMVYKALAQVTGLPQAVIAHRFIGDWQPSADFYRLAVDPEQRRSDSAKPYPFYLAYPLELDPDHPDSVTTGNQLENRLGPTDHWLAEWKWDGIRGQMLHHQSGVYLWSRGEDVITHQFPELAEAATQLPQGVVLDGEILCWREGRPEPFSALQKRLGRKRPSARFLRQYPAVFMAYDLLEYGHLDQRNQPLAQRKQLLATVLDGLSQPSVFRQSPPVAFDNWPMLEQLRQSARHYGVEGLMLKRLDSPYLSGRKKGDWWKYKVDPYTLDAVLLYAQPGSGRRASLYTDYTFGVWQDDELVPVAKAYSGLSDKAINRVDNWIRKNTVERFGPVRSVRPELVFELAFENIAPSPRHKSRLALRFPRIKRWREDKTSREADSLTMLEHLLAEKANGVSPLPAASGRIASPDQD